MRCSGNIFAPNASAMGKYVKSTDNFASFGQPKLHRLDPLQPSVFLRSGVSLRPNFFRLPQIKPWSGCAFGRDFFDPTDLLDLRVMLPSLTARRALDLRGERTSLRVRRRGYGSRRRQLNAQEPPTHIPVKMLMVGGSSRGRARR